MDFRILGPLEVLDAGRELTPTRAKHRTLLARLLMSPGEAVASDVLIDALWGERPPTTASKALHGHVSALRKLLGPERILTRSPGYLLYLEPGELDAQRFEALAGEARAAEDAARRSELLDEGLAMWRGDPFADFRYQEFAQGEIARLQERRLIALEDRAEAELTLGHHQEMLPGLERLLAEQPLRERLRELLMLALYRAGRQSDALRAYQDGRRLLAEELGLDPGPVLKALQEQILHQDAALDLASSPAERQARDWVVDGEERKLVTILAAEFLTGRPGLDPELLRTMLGPLQASVRAEVERLGGSLDRFVAGSVLAVFGVPIVHEDDPERAVTAGLRMLELAPQLGPDPPALSVRVGVATGEALVRAGVGSGTSDGLPEGEVIPAALALQRSAEGGSVVVDEPTAHAIRGAIELEELRLVQREGEPDASPAWRARRAAPKPGAPAATPFVGRQRELALLDTIRATVFEEEMPRLVTVVGEAGVGKTRLIDELIGHLGRETVIYRGRCLPYGEGVTYWPLREILWAAAGILLDEPAATASAKLGELVAALVDDRAEAVRTVAALARTAGIAVADDPLEGLTAESVLEEVGLAWPRFLGALARRRPTVVVVEDLHWAEGPLLDMLERLVSRSAGRLMIVTTARPEFAATRPTWSSTAGMVQIGLDRLTAAQARQLVANLLPAMSADRRERIAAPAEGNPFFCEELARHVVEEVASAGSPEIEAVIPDSIRSLVAARIDSLSDAEKRTLHNAAVVGRTFWATTLEAMAGGGSLREVLRSLEGKGFIAASPTSVLSGHVEFSFRHALKRDVAYRSIPRARRCRSHAAVAGWIEEVASDRYPEFVELLAYHYEAAARPQDAALAWPDGSPERERVRSAAVQSLIAAGLAARERLAFERAVHLANRALAIAAHDAERLAILDLRASALHAAVRCDEALAAYREAIELAGKLGDEAARSRLRAHAVLLCARYNGAFANDAWMPSVIELVEHGLEGVDETKVAFEIGALLIGRAEMSLQWLGEPASDGDTAEDDARRAVEIAEAIGSPYLLAHAVDSLIDATLRRGNCRQGELAERLIQISEALPDRAEAHDGLVSAAISFTFAGQYDRAREVAREATNKVTGLGAHHEIHAASAETLALLPAGRFAELADVAARAPEIVRDEGYRCWKAAVALAGFALTMFETGERSAADEALELLEPLLPGKPRWRAIDIIRPLAGVERAQRLVASLGHPPGAAIDHLDTVRLELQLTALAGEWDALKRLAREAEALARQACAPALSWIAEWAAAAQLAAGDGAGAVRRTKRALGSLEKHGELYTAARLFVDLLPFLEVDLREALAEDTIKRLEAMGAHGSAAEARAMLTA
jgi:DNA-binding SARP family transcriptional activator